MHLLLSEPTSAAVWVETASLAMEALAIVVIVVGILVLIRTFLGWSVIVELEGRWPWREAEARERERAAEQLPATQAGALSS